MREEYRACRLCPRQCGADRSRGVGFCGVGGEATLARAALHAWEEPPISGKRGSGTVFFSGCSLGCSFCQNRAIAHAEIGREVSEAKLCEIFLSLERAGAHNLNLVTAAHFVPSVLPALAEARQRGLTIPVVWNSGGYERLETLRLLRGAVDIFLVDFKYGSGKAAKALANAPDYPAVASAALAEMLFQCPRPRFGEDGMLKSGVIVRVLLLPGHLLDAKLALRRARAVLGDAALYSLMSQYTPMQGMPPPLDRRVSEAEYRSFVRYAESLGIRRGFTQEGESAAESFIPSFDYSGLDASVPDPIDQSI